MNFLSHYYFDLYADPYVVMGSVLPDLIKNAVKSGNLYPQKKEALFHWDPQQSNILKGWKRHLEVDKYFHASAFFITETAYIKKLILPVTEGTGIRPSFLAHIALELMLDHLLLKKNLLQPDNFYHALEEVDPEILDLFLANAGMTDTKPVLEFIKRFNSSRYLLSYRKLENISYAINRICMRLWPVCLSEAKTEELTHLLSIYEQSVDKDFLQVFSDLEARLK